MSSKLNKATKLSCSVTIKHSLLEKKDMYLRSENGKWIEETHAFRIPIKNVLRERKELLLKGLVRTSF